MASGVELLPTYDRHPGAGAVVMVGTHTAPFDRLLAAADDAAGRGLLGSPVTMQTGASAYAPRNADTARWLAPSEIERLVAHRRLVICHAGTGAMSAALEHGRRPLVLARRAALGEHLDDHQLELADELATLGLVVALGATIGERDVAAALAPLDAPAGLDALPALAVELRQALAAAGMPGL